MKSHALPVALTAVTAGVALELLVTASTGATEAWDVSAYWYLGIPLIIGVSGLLGFISPRHAWLWGALPIPAQLFTMAIRNEPGPLMLVGLLIGAVLSAPCIIAACIGARLQRARQRQSA